MKELKMNITEFGQITWLGVRPKRKGAIIPVKEINITLNDGIVGDHYKGKNKKRQVTLIQKEHLEEVALVLGQGSIDPNQTRRNIVVSGIDLLTFRGRRFKVGGAVLEYTGDCFPCKQMEENLGPGGLQAMEGKGGITARVLTSGRVRLEERVELLPPNFELPIPDQNFNLRLFE